MIWGIVRWLPPLKRWANRTTSNAKVRENKIANFSPKIMDFQNNIDVFHYVQEWIRWCYRSFLRSQKGNFLWAPNQFNSHIWVPKTPKIQTGGSYSPYSRIYDMSLFSENPNKVPGWLSGVMGGGAVIGWLSVGYRSVKVTLSVR